ELDYGTEGLNTKAQRHKERPRLKVIYAAFLSVFVPLCLCVPLSIPPCNLFWRELLHSGPEPPRGCDERRNGGGHSSRDSTAGRVRVGPDPGAARFSAPC